MRSVRAVLECSIAQYSISNMNEIPESYDGMVTAIFEALTTANMG